MCLLHKQTQVACNVCFDMLWSKCHKDEAAQHPSDPVQPGLFRTSGLNATVCLHHAYVFTISWQLTACMHSSTGDTAGEMCLQDRFKLAICTAAAIQRSVRSKVSALPIAGTHTNARTHTLQSIFVQRDTLTSLILSFYSNVILAACLNSVDLTDI